MREIIPTPAQLRNVMLALFLLAITCVLADAQSQAQQADQTPDELKTQEQILDELKFRRAQVTALNEQIAALGNQIKTLTDLSNVLRERGDFYKEAATLRNGAGEIEAEKDRIRREQLDEYKAEVARLRTENDSLRHSRDVRTILGLAIGAGTGFGLRH